MMAQTAPVARLHENAEQHYDVYAQVCRLGPAASDQQWKDALFAAEGLARRAFASRDRQAETQLHKILYSLYSNELLPPWSDAWTDRRDARFLQLRNILENAWENDDRRRLMDAVGPLPGVDGFEAWAYERCHSDRSNVSHPLFAYLRDNASFEELREFILQETPFDIHFGDIIALMLPGVYGVPKAEFSRNFWDEVGCGEAPKAHRQLRIDMMNAIGISEQLYLDAGRFCLEELRLANVYFQTTMNKALLPQAIGMLLATELMVPGRLDQQIQGWRRVGLEDAALVYLLEHTVVDVRHAAGWLSEVVSPLLEQHPAILFDLVFGIERRLDYAAAVCDRMMELLPNVRNDRRNSALGGQDFETQAIMIEPMDLDRDWPVVKRLLEIEDWPFIRADLEASEAQDRSVSLVGRVGGVIKGFYTTHNFNEIAYLDLIVVERSNRNFLLAHEMYKRADRELAARGIQARVAHCTKDSAPFLKQDGYVPGRKYALMRRAKRGPARGLADMVTFLGREHLDAIIAADAAAFGAARPRWIETLFTGDTSKFVGLLREGELKAMICLRARREGSICLDMAHAESFDDLQLLLDEVIAAYAEKQIDCFVACESDLHAYLAARGFSQPDFFLPIGPLVEYRAGAQVAVGLSPALRTMSWL